MQENSEAGVHPRIYAFYRWAVQCAYLHSCNLGLALLRAPPQASSSSLYGKGGPLLQLSNKTGEKSMTLPVVKTEGTQY